jgi:hypothetical protein
MSKDHSIDYETMIGDINTILAGDSSEIEKVESCFMTALRHWEIFKQRVRSMAFDNKADEIDFFKYTKPRFTALVEYYTQRYQALLFIPGGSPATRQYFWKMEERRIDRFFTQHAEFVHYYETGETELDELYFLREFGDGSNFGLARVYDLEERTSSSHDWIVCRIIAFNKYREDIHSALHILQRQVKVV